MFSRMETIAGYLFLDLAGSFLRFPIWWYGEGMHDRIEWAKTQIMYRWRGYAIGLWWKNFFVPMYGASDWAGRAISMVARFGVIIGRLLALAFECGFYLFVLFCWLLIPVFVTGMLLGNLLGGVWIYD